MGVDWKSFLNAWWITGASCFVVGLVMGGALLGLMLSGVGLGMVAKFKGVW